MTSSASRRSRRTAAKGKKVTGLSEASQQISETLQVQVKCLEGSVETLENLQKEIGYTNKLLEAIVNDLDVLNSEVGVQRETMLRLLAHFLSPSDGTICEETLRKTEEKLRAEVLIALGPTDGGV